MRFIIGWATVLLPKVTARAGTPRLSAVSAHLEVWGGRSPQILALEIDRITIGRSDDSTLVVRDPVASRLHALVEQVDGRWLIRDLSSRNGTYVNGERVVSDRVLRSGDEVRLGETRIVFRQTSGSVDQLEATRAAERPPDLTRREREILVALCQPSSDSAFWSPASVRTVAERLHLTEAGVKQHLSRLYEKFGLDAGGDRRTRLANEALRRGAITLSDVQGL